MIETKKIKEINFSDQVYFIPSYQRGYRWENKQVLELLEDIYEVYTTKQESYCLQPIVVSEIEPNRFEIIDGQQRLTTIYILLTRLKRYTDEKFQLDFQVRTNCIEFFKNLDEGTLDYSNPDFAHISNAYFLINKWFEDKKNLRVDSNIELNMFQTLLEKVEVIWYDVEEHNREELIKIFTRLNSGKIALTNAELIKALFLSKANFGNKNHDTYTSQLDISNKWNQIEYALQDDDFWNFIIPSQNNLETRIDYIFKLIVQNKEYTVKEESDVFRYYYPLYVKSLQTKLFDFVSSNWGDVELYFTIIQDWYTNHSYYHLIGLLIWDGEDVLSLIKKYQESTKKDFLAELFESVKDRFCGFNLETLDYKSNYRNVERILVFFNVMEAYRSKNTRFPFKQLKLREIKWSLEHIHPQNAPEIKQHEYLQWLEDHLTIIKHLNIANEHDGLIREIEGIILKIKETKNIKDFKIQFEELSASILNILTYNENNTKSCGEKSKIAFDKLGEEHHLSNMALLDTRRNSSLGNSAFSVKRKAIIDFELDGVFVPIATRNSFLKYYSDYPKHLDYWTLEDRDDYVSKIQEQINYVKNFKINLNEY
ncbi:uncharacterized protein DUF262 [Flavobacterium croceum DSM 17960]|uniref:Uncharacterized protein DUF262 n=1 Tax=Flavobacterium croceum DSM 17960 TaxID=1121886 RepID=A0A2S4N8U0_9FLAO|nr:DUF262 domain-containing protein [Flavobacterium croceum]POS02115.1 uncharacterized protein DUF262 [Flavobacterium croceum DSM 17960]